MLRALGRGFRCGVVQFGKGAWQSGERPAIERFGDQVEWHTLGEGFHLGNAGPRARCRRSRAGLDSGAQDDGRSGHAADRASTKLNISLRYDHLDGTAVIAALQGATARPARRGHRPQRQAELIEGGRPGQPR
jgi:cob(I)alamin adenosyltransferase